MAEIVNRAERWKLGPKPLKLPSTDPYNRQKKSALEDSFPGGVFLIPCSSRTSCQDAMAPGEERPLTVRHLGRGYKEENV